MSNSKAKHPSTTNNIISPKLRWMNNSRITIEFKGRCLKQDKVTFTSKELCFGGAVKLTNNDGLDKYTYSGKRIAL